MMHVKEWEIIDKIMGHKRNEYEKKKDSKKYKKKTKGKKNGKNVLL